MKKHYLAIIAAAMLAIPAWTPAEAFATSAENVQTRADEEFTLSFRHSRISDVIGPSSSKLTFTAETNKPANISITINYIIIQYPSYSHLNHLNFLHQSLEPYKKA